PSVLRIDNQSAIQVAKNPEHHVISPHFAPTDAMPADLLTKALARVKVTQFCDMLGLGPTGGS
ncbi:hypothetical protein HYDPIDRAFT_70979, partial [Hydnomerulius pinastri MD-312]